MPLIILWVVLALVFVVLGFAAGSRTGWWRLYAWQYRNPEANEPSEASFKATRRVFFALAALMLAIAVCFLGWFRSGEKEAQRREKEIEKEMAAQPSTFLPPTYNRATVRKKAEAVAAALPGRTQMQVEEVVWEVVGHDLEVWPGRTKEKSRGGEEIEAWELRARGDYEEKSSVCLVVRINDSDGVIKAATVKNGGC